MSPKRTATKSSTQKQLDQMPLLKSTTGALEYTELVDTPPIASIPPRRCVPQKDVAKVLAERDADELLCVYESQNTRAASASSASRQGTCPVFPLHGRHHNHSGSHSPQPCNKTHDHVRLRVAWAFAGTARTLASTAATLSTMMIDGFGGEASVLMHIALVDQGGKDQPGFSSQSTNGGVVRADASVADLLPAFEILQPRILSFRAGPAVCNMNCSCSATGYLKSNFGRAIDQLEGWRRVWSLVLHAEKNDRRAFDTVIRARYDMYWLAPMQPHCTFDLHPTLVYTPSHNADMFFVVQRRFAEQIFLTVHTYYNCTGDFVFCRKRSDGPPWHQWLRHMYRTPLRDQKVALPFTVRRPNAQVADACLSCWTSGATDLGFTKSACVQLAYTKTDAAPSHLADQPNGCHCCIRSQLIAGPHTMGFEHLWAGVQSDMICQAYSEGRCTSCTTAPVTTAANQTHVAGTVNIRCE